MSLQLTLSPYFSAKRWLVAYSGGLDSTVLLHYLAQLKQRPPIVAVYIHHGLQTVADDWLIHCQMQASEWGVEFKAVHVEVSRQGSIEANARQARYQAFASLIQSDDVLFMGHHANDQLETLLFRLARGTGLRGLAGIPKQREFSQQTAALIARPLLQYSKKQLEQYAQQHGLKHVEDPSNLANDYDRNFLRNAIVPVLEQRWPQLAEAATQTAEYLSEGQALLDEIAEQDVTQLSQTQWGLPCFNITLWQQYTPLRKNNSLRYWLYQQGAVLGVKSWQQLLDWLAESKAASMQLSQAVLHYEGGLLYYVLAAKNEEITAQTWHTAQPLQLQSIGEYCIEPELNLQLEVRPRRGGEKIQLAENRPRKTLKALYQELAVPRFLRQQIPLFYYQGELIAVGELALSPRGKSLLQNSRLRFNGF